MKNERSLESIFIWSDSVRRTDDLTSSRVGSIPTQSARWDAVTHGAELQRTDRGATGRIQIRQSAPKQLRVGFGK